MLTDRGYKAIGFAGCGQNTLMSACIAYLRRQGVKLLVMDFSEAAELRTVIPLPRELEEVTNLVLSYHDVDYIHAEGETQIQDFAFDYEVVLVDFGRQTAHMEAEACDCMYYLTDMQRHNILTLKKVRTGRHQRFVLCNSFPKIQTVSLVAEEIGASKEQFTVLPYDEREHMQTVAGISIDRIAWKYFSSQTRHFVRDAVKDLYAVDEEKHTVIRTGLTGAGTRIRVAEKQFYSRLSGIGEQGREKVWS